MYNTLKHLALYFFFFLSQACSSFLISSFSWPIFIHQILQNFKSVNYLFSLFSTLWIHSIWSSSTFHPILNILLSSKMGDLREEFVPFVGVWLLKRGLRLNSLEDIQVASNCFFGAGRSFHFQSSCCFPGVWYLGWGNEWSNFFMTLASRKWIIAHDFKSGCWTIHFSLASFPWHWWSTSRNLRFFFPTQIGWDLALQAFKNTISTEKGLIVDLCVLVVVEFLETK
jgi:hypothetical protein